MGGRYRTWMGLEAALGFEDMSVMGRAVSRKEGNGRGCGRGADMRLKVGDLSWGWNGNLMVGEGGMSMQYLLLVSWRGFLLRLVG